MRFWFDLLTPKQVLFFGPIIGELEKRGHSVMATSRRYREVEHLASMKGLRLEYVGERAGRDLGDQLRSSLERTMSLLPLVQAQKPETAVSVASVDCARIAFGLGIRHVAVNDSPHSTVAGRLALPLSSHLLTPWIIPYSVWARFGLGRGEITRYRALDPAAWLKRERLKPRPPEESRTNPVILVRLEESYAPYMAGSDGSWPERVLRRIASEFEGFRLIALCRYQEQLEWVRREFGRSFEVPEEVVDGAAMIAASDVFIGMGGTMTTEAALMGVPAVSAFQGTGLYTERYLLSQKLLLKSRSLDSLPRLVRRALREDYRVKCSRRARSVLGSMEDPVVKVAEYLVAS